MPPIVPCATQRSRRARRSWPGLPSGGRCSASGRGTCSGSSGDLGQLDALEFALVEQHLQPRCRRSRRMWWPQCWQTCRLASRSRWKIICSQLGHFCQRFSGTSFLRVPARGASAGRNWSASSWVGPRRCRVISRARRARRRPGRARRPSTSSTRPGAGPAVVVQIGGDAVDDGGADHGGVGDPRDGGGLLPAS